MLKNTNAPTAGTVRGAMTSCEATESLARTLSLRDRRAASVPAKYRTGYVRAVEGAVSPRQAIKAKCLDCSAWQREEVRACQVRACPLWSYRPFQTTRRIARVDAEPLEGVTSGAEACLDETQAVPSRLDG